MEHVLKIMREDTTNHIKNKIIWLNYIAQDQFILKST